jgi:hypothetical protein
MGRSFEDIEVQTSEKVDVSRGKSCSIPAKRYQASRRRFPGVRRAEDNKTCYLVVLRVKRNSTVVFYTLYVQGL